MMFGRLELGPFAHSSTNVARASIVCAMLVCGQAGCGTKYAVQTNADPQPKDEVAAGPTVKAEIDLPPVEAASLPGAEEMPTSGTGPTPPEAPTVKPRFRPLSEEEMTRWRRAAFEPFHLLDCRAESDHVLTTCFAPIPGSQTFVRGGKRLLRESIRKGVAASTLFDLSQAAEDTWLTSTAVSPDGKFVAAGDSEGWLRIWDLGNEKELAARQAHSNDVVEMAISPDSKTIATISFGDGINLWDIPTLAERTQFKVEDSSLARIMFVGPQLLCTAGINMSLWDITARKSVKEISNGKYCRSFTKHSLSGLCAFGVEQGYLFWDSSQEKIVSELRADFGTKELADFSPDGKYFVTASGSSVRIWDLASRQCVQVMDAHGPTIIGLSWVPDANVILIISENGVMRTWGTAQAGAAVGLERLHAEVALPSSEPICPATPSQYQEVIDLRSFPRPPNSTPLLESAEQVRFVSGLSVQDTQRYYVHFLTEAGWNLQPIDPNTPDYLEFSRQGFRLWSSISAGDQQQIEVTLVSQGNFGPRKVPKLAAHIKDQGYEYESAVQYESESNLLDLEIELLQKLQAAGWTPYSRLHTSHGQELDARSLDFVWNSILLRVSVRKFESTPGLYTVQYANFYTINSLPIPRDATYVEFDGSTEPYLVAITGLGLEACRSFYDQEMRDQGWLPYARGRSVKDAHCWLPYFRGQRDVMVGLSTLKNGKTLIRVGDDLESASWQLAALKSPAQDQVTDTQDRPHGDGDASQEKEPAIGIQAADFLITEGAEDTKFDSLGKSLEYRAQGKTVQDLTTEYTSWMEKLGWHLDSSGVRSDEYSLLPFKQGESWLDIRLSKLNAKTIVNISGAGLLWDKELPGGKPLISYETWLRTNHVIASLEYLERYRAEMRALNQVQQ